MKKLSSSGERKKHKGLTASLDQRLDAGTGTPTILSHSSRMQAAKSTSTPQHTYIVIYRLTLIVMYRCIVACQSASRTGLIATSSLTSQRRQTAETIARTFLATRRRWQTRRRRQSASQTVLFVTATTLSTHYSFVFIEH